MLNSGNFIKYNWKYILSIFISSLALFFGVYATLQININSNNTNIDTVNYNINTAPTTSNNSNPTFASIISVINSGVQLNSSFYKNVYYFEAPSSNSGILTGGYFNLTTISKVNYCGETLAYNVTLPLQIQVTGNPEFNLLIQDTSNAGSSSIHNVTLINTINSSKIYLVNEVNNWGTETLPVGNYYIRFVFITTSCIAPVYNLSADILYNFGVHYLFKNFKLTQSLIYNP
jgi:hypothetical protein